MQVEAAAAIDLAIFARVKMYRKFEKTLEAKLTVQMYNNGIKILSDSSNDFIKNLLACYSFWHRWYGNYLTMILMSDELLCSCIVLSQSSPSNVFQTA